MQSIRDRGVRVRQVCRNVHIEKLDQQITELLSELNMEGGLKKHRYSGSLYFTCFGNFFINRWLFSEQDVSIGIYEDIFSSRFDEVAFDYYSDDSMKLDEFSEGLRANWRGEAGVPPVKVYENNDGDTEFAVQILIGKREFLNDPKTTLRPLVEAYAAAMKSAFSVDLSSRS